MNAQSGESINFFYDEEAQVFTIRQWHVEDGAPDGGQEHYVTISAHMLAAMAEEAGIAEVDYGEEEESED